MRVPRLVSLLAGVGFIGIQLLLLSAPAYAACCPCGGPCPMYSGNRLVCSCCICGTNGTVSSYSASTGTGTLKIKTLHGSTESLTFTVHQSVREKLGALKSGEEHQFSLRFSGDLAKGLKVECFGIDEGLPDRTPSVQLTRELMTVLRNTPTHEPDHQLDKK